jgi:tetratricopeptide (TPR) repeat protein
MEAPKPFAQKNQPVKGGSPAAKPAAGVPAAPVKLKIPPLFRRIDWLTTLITLGVVWIVYFLTLAPEVTLYDSGELCAGAFYAGIPHPPGYPFWSIYSWVWCSLLRFGNVAWRVEVGEATGVAVGCALVALMVSRGSSMLIEGIDDLKGLTKKWENAICLVSGAVTGICFGLGGVMWSEAAAINRISLFGVPWIMVVLVCMLRWLYAPSQRRYLYWAMFIFGLCTTIHQTLLCAGLGIEVCIAMANPRLGRHFFLFNSFLLGGGGIVKLTGMTSALNVDPTLLLLFTSVLVASVVGYFLLAIVTRESVEEFCKDGSMAAVFLLVVFALSRMMHKADSTIFWVLALGALGSFVYFVAKTHKLGWEWVIVIVCGLLVALGVAFYLWEPITCMTNPPMEWSYPRTVNGFWRAVHRGQYEDAHPTDLTSGAGLNQFYHQFGILVSDIAEDSNWLLLFAALIPLLLLLKMKKRERSWIIGLGAIYGCIGILLLILMNPQDDKQSVELHQVFFASSHGLLAILMGYGLALTVAYMATNYRKFRPVGLALGGLALLPALNAFYNSICNTYFWGGTGLAEFQYVISLTLTLSAAFVLAWMAARMWERVKAQPAAAPPVPDEGDPKFYFMMTAGGAAIMTLVTIYFAFFNERSLSPGEFLAAVPRMFTLRLANLPAVGGALILAVAVVFLLGVFLCRDRGPVALTLGLFLVLPLTSAMSHWAPSEQRNHWFGYWFGHDMFTPPFTGPDGKLSYDPKLREQAMKGPNGNLVYPEMTRDAILFGGTDPGRFTPEYMIYCESFTPHEKQPVQDQNFDRRDVYIITQNALADDTYLDYLRAQYNRSLQIDPPFFENLFRSDEEQSYHTTNHLAKLIYTLLDKPLTRIGAEVEAKRRAYGLYPEKEIYIPSYTDMQQAFQDYQSDVYRRYQHDNDPRFSGEQKQLRPGETFVPSSDGVHVQFNGQVSVMSINGFLAKDIFDRNPSNEFYVEESFPLDWMFPYLSPFGDIMKINRQPLAEITPEMIRRDHEFWSHYSDRTVGNWITYDTTIKDITNWIEKVYVQHDFTGFTGDRRFMRDESAQKSFSKLRTAVAGIYAWRLGLRSGVPTPAEYLPKSPEAQARMIKEADFAYRQAFAYCPYSPEVVFNYAVFLATLRRPEEALAVAETCLRLDPNNEGVANLVRELQGSMRSAAAPAAAPPAVNNAQAQMQAALGQLEAEVRANPTNYPAALELAQAYLKAQQGTKAQETLGAIPPQYLEGILSNSNSDVAALNAVVSAYYVLQKYPELETALKRLTQLQSDSAENWYNLACLESDMGKREDALNALQHALANNRNELAANPKAINLRTTAASDRNFANLSNMPEFKAMLNAPK